MNSPIRNMLQIDQPQIFQDIAINFYEQEYEKWGEKAKEAWDNPIMTYNGRFIPETTDENIDCILPIDFQPDRNKSYILPFEPNKYFEHVFVFEFEINHHQWREMTMSIHSDSMENIIRQYFSIVFEKIGKTFEVLVENGVCVPHWLSKRVERRYKPMKIGMIEIASVTPGYKFAVFFHVLSPHNVEDFYMILNNEIVFDKERGRVNLGLKGLYRFDRERQIFLNNVQLPKDGKN